MFERTTPFFGHGVQIYALKDGANRNDLSDAIAERLKQTDAALLAISGEGFESFSGMSLARQNDYLWMLHSMVTEARDLFEAMSDMASKEGHHA